MKKALATTTISRPKNHRFAAFNYYEIKLLTLLAMENICNHLQRCRCRDSLNRGIWAATFLSDACQPEMSFFSLLICLDAAKFVLLRVFTLIETIYPRICSKSRPRSEKKPLPVDVRRSKSSLLKLPQLSKKEWLAKVGKKIRNDDF